MDGKKDFQFVGCQVHLFVKKLFCQLKKGSGVMCNRVTKKLKIFYRKIFENLFKFMKEKFLTFLGKFDEKKTRKIRRRSCVFRMNVFVIWFYF